MAHPQEIYTLLYENYVEDDDNMFRFDYSKEFLQVSPFFCIEPEIDCFGLQWALMPPGYHPEWHVGMRMKSKKAGKVAAMRTFASIPCHSHYPAAR